MGQKCNQCRLDNGQHKNWCGAGKAPVAATERRVTYASAVDASALVVPPTMLDGERLKRLLDDFIMLDLPSGWVEQTSTIAKRVFLNVTNGAQVFETEEDGFIPVGGERCKDSPTLLQAMAAALGYVVLETIDHKFYGHHRASCGSLTVYFEERDGAARHACEVSHYWRTKR